MNKQELIEKWEKEMTQANRLKHLASDDFTKGCESEKVLVISSFLEDLKQLNEDIRVPPSESDSVCPDCGHKYIDSHDKGWHDKLVHKKDWQTAPKV